MAEPRLASRTPICQEGFTAQTRDLIVQDDRMIASRSRDRNSGLNQREEPIMRKGPKRLGRGLSSLITNTVDSGIQDEHSETEAAEQRQDQRESDGKAGTVPASGTSDSGAQATGPRNGNLANASVNSVALHARDAHSARSEQDTPNPRQPGRPPDTPATRGAGQAGAVARTRAAEDVRAGIEEPGEATSGVSAAAGRERKAAAGAARSGGFESRIGGIEARMVGIDDLRPNKNQPRRTLGEAECHELALSIAANGIIQPIVARRTFDGLEILAGERRWRSARMAGLKEVPVLVREANDEEMLELALIENIHREDLNAVDRGLAYKQYCDVFGLKAEEIAARLGEDRTTVVNYMRLLDLPQTVLSLLAEGRISMGHARALLGAKTPMHGIELAEAVAAGGMSVRSLESLLRRSRSPRKPKAPKPEMIVGEGLPKHIQALERKFEEVMCTKVSIELGETRKTGRVVIEFFSLDDFERVCHAAGVVKKAKEE